MPFKAGDYNIPHETMDVFVDLLQHPSAENEGYGWDLQDSNPGIH